MLLQVSFQKKTNKGGVIGGKNSPKIDGGRGRVVGEIDSPHISKKDAEVLSGIIKVFLM